VVGELISHSTHPHGAQAVKADASKHNATVSEARRSGIIACPRCSLFAESR
jgi:hypothetical protein